MAQRGKPLDARSIVRIRSLAAEGLTVRAIAARLAISVPTVLKYKPRSQRL